MPFVANFFLNFFLATNRLDALWFPRCGPLRLRRLGLLLLGRRLLGPRARARARRRAHLPMLAYHGWIFGVDPIGRWHRLPVLPLEDVE